MKNILTLLGILTGLTANAQLSNVQNQFMPQENYAINGGFENGKANWTASAGTFTITSSSSNVARGGFAGSMDFSAALQTLSMGARTIPGGLINNNCIAEAMIKGGDANITMQVYNGTDPIASQVLSAYATYTKVSIPFVCPSSGTLAIRFISSADAAVFYADDAMWGANYRVGTVAQAKFIGSLKYAGTASCVFSGTSASYANYAADTDCATPTVTGQVTAPGTKIPAATLSSVEPGTYKFTVSTTMTAAASECLWRISDGTNNSDDFSAQYSNGGNYTRGGQLTAFITYSTGQGSTTFNLQHRKVAGTGCDLEVDTSNHDFVMKIEKLPSNSETVYAPNMQAVFGGARWSHTSGASSSLTSASWNTFSDAEFNSSRVMTGAAVACSNANDICFKMPKVPVGKYLVMYRGGGLAIGTGATANVSLRIYDGTTSKSMNMYNSTSNVLHSNSMINGIFEYTSEQSNIEYKLQATVDYGTVSLSLDRDDNTKMNAEFVMIPLEQGIPMPVIVGGTVSSEWTTYSLTIGGTITPPTLGTTTVNKAQWRRVGDSMEIKYDLIQTSAGTAGSGDYLFPLPAGYTIDTAKHNIQADRKNSYCGNGNSNDGGTAVMLTAYAYNTTNIALAQASNLLPVGSTNGVLTNTNMAWSFRCLVPISGWKNNQ